MNCPGPHALSRRCRWRFLVALTVLPFLVAAPESMLSAPKKAAPAEVPAKALPAAAPAKRVVAPAAAAPSSDPLEWADLEPSPYRPPATDLLLSKDDERKADAMASFIMGMLAEERRSEERRV